MKPQTLSSRLTFTDVAVNSVPFYIGLSQNKRTQHETICGAVGCIVVRVRTTCIGCLDVCQHLPPAGADMKLFVSHCYIGTSLDKIE